MNLSTNFLKLLRQDMLIKWLSDLLVENDHFDYGWNLKSMSLPNLILSFHVYYLCQKYEVTNCPHKCHFSTIQMSKGRNVAFLNTFRHCSDHTADISVIIMPFHKRLFSMVFRKRSITTPTSYERLSIFQYHSHSYD